MRRLIQFVGTIVFFCAWPAYFFYHKFGYGRTRAVLVNNGKVLVMKQWVGPGKWQLPGGGLHRGESLPGGAVREVREETSLILDPRQLTPIGKGIYKNYGHSFVFHAFATAVGSNGVRAQRLEVSELAWMHPGDLRRRNAEPDVLMALQMAKKKGFYA